MKTVSGKEFSKILEKQGWRLLRVAIMFMGKKIVM